jgi:hypothetical protein
MLRFRSQSELLLPALVLALEIASVAPLLALAASGLDRDNATGSPFIPLLWVIALLAYWLARRTSGGGEIDARPQATVFLGGVVVAFVAPLVMGVGPLWDAPVFGVAILASGEALLAWWRGVYYASRSDAFSADDLSDIVRRSWIVLAGSLLLIPIVNGIEDDPALVTAAVALPVAALSAFFLLALGQVERADRRAKLFGGSPPDRRQWLTLTAVFAVLTVVIAMGIGAAIGDDTAQAILTPFALAFDAIIFVLSYVLYGIALVLFVLFYPIAWLIERYRKEPEGQQQEEPQNFRDQIDQLKDSGNGGNGFPHWLQLTAEIGAVVLVVALVALLITRTLRKPRTEDVDGESSETHESLWSRELAWNQLKGLFQRGPHDDLERIDLTRTPESVREAYRSLLALAQRDGVPRRPDETPAEFAARLRAAWPALANDVGGLTREYELARYGGISEHTADERARGYWSAIWGARRETTTREKS